MEIQGILKTLREENQPIRKNNWLNVCKLPDRRLVAGKQAKHSQIQIP